MTRVKRYFRYIAAAGVAAIAIAAAVVVYVATARRADPNIIRFATDEAFPPFGYVDAEGVLRGFDVDIAEALCEKMKVECPIVARDFNAIVAGLLDGEYDAIVAQVAVAEEQESAVSFSKIYREMPSRFLQRKGAGHAITESGLAGKTIGVQGATAHEKFVRTRFGDVATVVPYPTLSEALAEIAAGRVDLIFADGVALGEGFLETDAGVGFEFVGTGFTDSKWFGEGTGIALREDDEDLRRRLDEAIDAIHDDGTYGRVWEEHFPAEIYGE